MNTNEGRGTNVDVDADLQRMMGGSSEAVITHIPDTSPESLMAKFQRQQALEKSQNERDLNIITEEVNSFKEQVAPLTYSAPQPARYTEPIRQEEPANTSSIRARINEMEAKLGIGDVMPANGKTYNAQSYLDDLGDESFFIQNISNGHVLVSDLSLKIPRGKTLDLLKYCDLESIKKSRDIRVALANTARSGPMIKRLTPTEYLTKMDQEYKENVKIEQFKKVSQLRAASGQTGENAYSEPIRPVVYDKLNKLRLSYSDTPHKGITPVEFAQWVQTEDLTKSELDQILAQIDDNELRILVNERKKLILERS